MAAAPVGKVEGIDSVPSDITNEYDVGETLGTGHFSKVKLGVHKTTKEKVAIKARAGPLPSPPAPGRRSAREPARAQIITKPTGSKIAMLKAEVDILLRCDHPHIVKLHRVFETETTLYLVLELLTGGELFDTIIQRGHYSEADARTLTRTMLDAILYLHTQGVAHRDLKPENILLKDAKDAAAIKITDFGLSKIFSDDLAGEVVMKTACGTPGYVAPEVLKREQYSSQVWKEDPRIRAPTPEPQPSPSLAAAAACRRSPPSPPLSRPPRSTSGRSA